MYLRVSVYVFVLLAVVITGCGSGTSSFAWTQAEQLEIDGKHEMALEKAKKVFLDNMDRMQGSALSNLSTDHWASVEKCIPEDILRLTAALCRGTEDPDLIARRGFIYAAIHEFELAIRDFDRALGLNSRPDIVVMDIGAAGSVLLCRGLAKWQSGDLDGALADLDETLRRSPDQDRAYYYRAVIHGKLGNTSQALRDIQQAMKLGRQEYYAQYLAELTRTTSGGEILFGTFIIAFFPNAEPLNRPFGYIWMVEQ